MSVETDALSEAAKRFAEVIQAERTTTIAALEQERQAAVQIIEALRRESANRARNARGRFVVGFMIGAAIGAVAVTMLAPRSGNELRKGLTLGAASGQASLNERLKSALSAGQSAAASREQELWSEYRKRVAESERKPDEPSYL